MATVSKDNPASPSSAIADQDSAPPKTVPTTRPLLDPNQSLALEKTAASETVSNTLVTSPIFVGVSRSSRKSKAEFKHVCEALCGLDSSDADALGAAMVDLGYRRTTGSGFAKGDDVITLSPFQLGNARGQELEFSRGRKTYRAASIAQSIIPIDLWNTMRERFADEVARFTKARARHPDQALPTELKDLKAFVKLGLSKKERKKDAAKAQDITKKLEVLGTKLAASLAEGTAPKGILVYVAGPDAVGKSSTGAIVMDALQMAG
jgi:hypothetical protein